MFAKPAPLRAPKAAPFLEMVTDNDVIFTPRNENTRTRAVLCLRSIANSISQKLPRLDPEWDSGSGGAGISAQLELISDGLVLHHLHQLLLPRLSHCQANLAIGYLHCLGQDHAHHRPVLELLVVELDPDT